MERMHRIHQLLQNKEYPNCTKLAKEFEVVKRTMKRDIEFMKDQMCLPIGFDTRRNGYFYTETVDHFPELPMSEADVFALYVASKAIEQYKGTPFQRLLETAFRRLTGRPGAGLPSFGFSTGLRSATRSRMTFSNSSQRDSISPGSGCSWTALAKAAAALCTALAPMLPADVFNDRTIRSAAAKSPCRRASRIFSGAPACCSTKC